MFGWGALSKTAAKARAGFFASKRSADPAMATMRSAAADAQKSRLPQMAAALSYRTIFGLLPVIIVAMVGVKYFASEEDVRTAVEKALAYSGLSAIAVPSEEMFIGPPAPSVDATAMDGSDPAEAAVPDPEVSQATDEPVGGDQGEEILKEIAANASANTAPGVEPPPAVDKWITNLINRVNKISLTTIGWTAAAMLVYAAMAMLVEIELAFNQIYRVPRGRSWARRVMQYWTLLTLGPLGLVATFVVSQQYIAMAQARAAEWGVKFGTATLPTIMIGYAITVSISTLFFFIAYITVPNTKVKLRPALAGAFTAALLWEAGKWGFTQYLSVSSGTAKLYGALALLPLFLLWVYFTWLIILFGLQIAYQLQHGRAKTRAQPISDMGPMLVDPAAALVVLTAIARGFDAGKTLDAPTLAKNTKLPEPVVRLVVGKLAERGILHRLENPGEDAESTYALARSPAAIRVAEVLELGYELAGAIDSDDAIEGLHRAQIDMVGEQTLATLAVGRPTSLPGLNTRGSIDRSPAPRLIDRPSQPTTARPETTPATLEGPR